jgi:CRP-like cAMP-binding protein
VVDLGVSVILYGPGNLFGEMSVIDRQPRSATAEAMEDVVLLVMSAQDFRRHLRTSHQLALNLMLTLSERLRRTTDTIRSLASLDVIRRIAKRLLSLALRQGVQAGEGVRIDSRLRQGVLVQPDQRQP